MRLKKNYRELDWSHVLIWILIFIYIFLTHPLRLGLISKFLYIILMVLNYVFSFYLITKYFFPLYYHKAKFLFLFLLTADFCRFCFVDFVLVKKILLFLGGHHVKSNLANIQFIKNTILIYSFVIFASVGNYLNRRSINRMNEIVRLEKENLVLQLAYLKNQFHSHLTFNFLNFCYGKFNSATTKTSDLILEFSETLNYTLLNKIGDMVEIAKELEFIESYFKIQRVLRPQQNFLLNIQVENLFFQFPARTLSSFIEFVVDLVNPELKNEFVFELSQSEKEDMLIMIISSSEDLNIKSHKQLEDFKRNFRIYFQDNFELSLNSKSFYLRIKTKPFCIFST